MKWEHRSGGSTLEAVTTVAPLFSRTSPRRNIHVRPKYIILLILLILFTASDFEYKTTSTKKPINFLLLYRGSDNSVALRTV